jgi:hypothetical protein
MSEHERQNPTPHGAAPERANLTEQLLEKGAEQADQFLGREDPKDILEPLKDIEVLKIIPRSIRDSESLKVVNRGVSLGAAWIAIVMLIAGNGTVSLGVATTTAAIKGSPTVGAYLTFGEAFFFTLAFSISAALFAYMVFRRQMKTWGAVSLWILATVAVTALCKALGIAGPSYQDLLYRITTNSGGPLGDVFTILATFEEYYTPLPFMCGMIAGVITGWIASRLLPQ